MSPNKVWLMCSHRAGKTVIQAALAKGGNIAGKPASPTKQAKLVIPTIGESDDGLAKVDRLGQIGKGRRWSNAFNCQGPRNSGGVGDGFWVWALG